MQAHTTGPAAELDELEALDIELESEVSVTRVKRGSPENPDSDKLLVDAINAVARLRDTVDRVTIFCELKRLLVNECGLLDQQIDTEQRDLAAIVQQGQARLSELQERKQSVVRALQIPAMRAGRAEERSPAAPSATKASPPPLARKGGTAASAARRNESRTPEQPLEHRLGRDPR